jgi:hypothetical protein
MFKHIRPLDEEDLQGHHPRHLDKLTWRGMGCFIGPLICINLPWWPTSAVMFAVIQSFRSRRVVVPKVRASYQIVSGISSSAPPFRRNQMLRETLIGCPGGHYAQTQCLNNVEDTINKNRREQRTEKGCISRTGGRSWMAHSEPLYSMFSYTLSSHPWICLDSLSC